MLIERRETGFLSKNLAFSIDAYRNPVSWFVAKGRFRGAKETGFLSRIYDFSIDAYRNPVSEFKGGDRARD
jgi:hypothetical protein